MRGVYRIDCWCQFLTERCSVWSRMIEERKRLCIFAETVWETDFKAYVKFRSTTVHLLAGCIR